METKWIQTALTEVEMRLIRDGLKAFYQLNTAPERAKFPMGIVVPAAVEAELKAADSAGAPAAPQERDSSASDPVRDR